MRGSNSDAWDRIFSCEGPQAARRGQRHADAEVSDAAGRAAYLAGFHAAQALISERTGRAVKSHKGVNAEWHRLVRDDASIDHELRAFLGFAYNLKAIADYATGPGSDVSPELASEALAIATRFVAKMAEIIEAR